MKALLLAFLLLTLSLPAFALDTPKGYETGGVVLYQPNDVLQERVGAVSELANYIKQLQAVCAESLASTTTPETLHIVVAVRPGKRSRVWFVSGRSTPDAQRDPLRKKLEAVTPCEVSAGPIAFAVTAKLAGGDRKDSTSDKDFKPPMPKEWQNAKTGKESVIIPDGILDVIWPNKQ